MLDKNEGVLFRDTSADGRSKDGTFSLSWGVPWGPPRPPKEVLSIRRGHPSSRQLESLKISHCPATTSPLQCVVVSSVEQPTTAPVPPSKKAVDSKGIGASGGGCAGSGGGEGDGNEGGGGEGDGGGDAGQGSSTRVKSV